MEGRSSPTNLLSETVAFYPLVLAVVQCCTASNMSLLLRLAAFVILLVPPVAVSETQGIEGRWLSGDGDGWIEISVTGNRATRRGSTS